jgi:hypothetical protein
MKHFPGLKNGRSAVSHLGAFEHLTPPLHGDLTLAAQFGQGGAIRWACPNIRATLVSLPFRLVVHDARVKYT